MATVREELQNLLETVQSKEYEIREMNTDIARIQNKTFLAELDDEARRIVCSIIKLAIEGKQLEIYRELAKVQLNEEAQ